MANEIVEIKTLEDLQRQKEMYKGKIDQKEQNIRKMWHQLFHNPEKKQPNTPSARLARALTIGSSVFDGALLGWKLYRRFKR